MLVLAGAGMGVTASISTQDSGWVAFMASASLAHAPALALSTGFAVAPFGLVPRATALAWAVPGYALLVGVLGGFLSLPGWLGALSPFDHTPQVPVEDLALIPLVVTSAGAIALILAGLRGFARRDVTTV